MDKSLERSLSSSYSKKSQKSQLSDKNVSESLSTTSSSIGEHTHAQIQPIQLNDQTSSYNSRIFVMVRMKPPKNAKDSCILLKPNTLENTIALTKVETSQKTKTFQFDRVFGPYGSQFNVYQSLHPIIMDIAKGINTCIFA